jgi:hypothetical protein
MMLGQVFQPGADEDLRRRLNAQVGVLGPQANEALRIISLHLPQVLAGHAIAPADLLRRALAVRFRSRRCCSWSMAH